MKIHVPVTDNLCENLSSLLSRLKTELFFITQKNKLVMALQAAMSVSGIALLSPKQLGEKISLTPVYLVTCLFSFCR